MSLEALVQPTVRRYKRIELCPDLILDLLKIPPEGVVVDGIRITVVNDPIPKDARVVRVGVNHRGNVAMVIEDASYDMVVEGSMIEEITPLYHSEDLRDQTLGGTMPNPEPNAQGDAQ